MILDILKVLLVLHLLQIFSENHIFSNISYILALFFHIFTYILAKFGHIFISYLMKIAVGGLQSKQSKDLRAINHPTAMKDSAGVFRAPSKIAFTLSVNSCAYYQYM